MNLAPGAPAIDRHRNHDDRADDDLLDVVGPTDLLAAVTQKRHDQSADHRPRYAAFAAAQTTAADHYRRDDVQLRTRRDRRIALAQTRHLHHTRETEEQTRERVDPHFQAIGRDAARARRGFI